MVFHHAQIYFYHLINKSHMFFFLQTISHIHHISFNLMVEFIAQTHMVETNL